MNSEGLNDYVFDWNVSASWRLTIPGVAMLTSGVRSPDKL